MMRKASTGRAMLTLCHFGRSYAPFVTSSCMDGEPRDLVGWRMHKYWVNPRS